MSETSQKHESIASALASAQSEMGKALKQSQNPHFRSSYADLASVVDACMPALNNNGIAVIQPLFENEFGRTVVTRFIHTSGQELECPVPLIIGKNDMQGLGSAITYARRYGLMSLAGIAPEDDDGNAATKNAPKNKPQSWAETIISELPESATEHEKARAVTDALKAQFKRKKSTGELSNEWERRSGLIGSFENRFKDMHAEIVSAFEDRIIALEPTSNMAAE